MYRQIQQQINNNKYRDALRLIFQAGLSWFSGSSVHLFVHAGKVHNLCADVHAHFRQECTLNL